MPICIGLGNGFWIGGGGGGGGGAQTFAQLKCVWARNVFGSQRKKSDVGHNYPVPTTHSMLWCNFLWGLRNWLHDKAALFWLHT